MVGLSVPEARRLVAMLSASPAERAHRLRWSRWRRVHQAAARRGHIARRARAAPPAPAGEGPPVVAVPPTPALAEAGWARVVPLLAPKPGQTGRPPHDHRPIVEGLLWVMRRGASWREIPAAYGPWQTLASRYQRWRRDGTWARLVAALRSTEADPPGGAVTPPREPGGNDAGLYCVDRGRALGTGPVDAR